MADERTPRDESFVELPAGTAWPMVAAFGITLGFAGLVTNFLVTVVGVVLTIAGAVGWFRDVLPVEQVERVPLRPTQPPVAAAKRTVDHLVPGEEGHRVSVPESIHPYSAGVWGGLAGGAAMAALAMLYGLIAYGSIWYPINLLAAVAMPGLADDDLAQLTALNPLALGVAVVTHGITSIFVGLVYAAILPTFPRRAELMGGIVAPLVWTGVLWASLGVINPLLNERIDWRWFVASQIAFGLVCGFVIARSERIATMQSWPLAKRVGIEAAGISAEHEDDR